MKKKVSFCVQTSVQVGDKYLFLDLWYQDLKMVNYNENNKAY